MIDAPQLTAPVIEPPAQIAPAKRRGRPERSARARRRAAAIGTIIVLSDGTACRVAWIAPDGTPYCYPVRRED